MKPAICTAAVFALASLCLCSAARAELVTIDIPGATSIVPAAINDKGQVTGYYCVGGPHCHGFIWRQDRALVTFDAPHALFTRPVAISPTGVIIGESDSKHLSRGFVRAADGTFTAFKVPNSAYTSPTGANRNGWSVGFWGADVQHPTNRPFLRSPSGATTEFTENTVPGAAYYPPLVVNRSQTVAGNTIIQNVDRGFVRTADGTITLIENPDGDTVVGGINDAGTVVGTLATQQSVSGYFRTSDGTITTFAAPNGSKGTNATAINNSGTIGGQFRDSNGTAHGFVRAPDGTFTPFDIDGTNPLIVAINNKGVVTGSYQNKDGSLSGFFGTP